MAKYVNFLEITTFDSKYKKWAASVKDDSGIVGEIRWFDRFECYCYCPSFDAILGENSLREIADFCELQTKSHREAWAKGEQG